MPGCSRRAQAENQTIVWGHSIKQRISIARSMLVLLTSTDTLEWCNPPSIVICRDETPCWWSGHCTITRRTYFSYLTPGRGRWSSPRMGTMKLWMPKPLPSITKWAITIAWLAVRPRVPGHLHGKSWPCAKISDVCNVFLQNSVPWNRTQLTRIGQSVLPTSLESEASAQRVAGTLLFDIGIVLLEKFWIKISIHWTT